MLNHKAASDVHRSYWVICGVALIWNLMGLANFVWQMNPASLASYPEAERAIIESRPAWATAAFAIAVVFGVLGCGALLLRRSAATALLVVSLLGVVATTFHAFGVIGATSFGALIPPISALVVAAFLVWYARRAQARGWLRPA